MTLIERRKNYTPAENVQINRSLYELRMRENEITLKLREPISVVDGQLDFTHHDALLNDLLEVRLMIAFFPA